MVKCGLHVGRIVYCNGEFSDNIERRAGLEVTLDARGRLVFDDVEDYQEKVQNCWENDKKNKIGIL